MKQTVIIATAVSAILYSASASAVDLYQDRSNSVTASGAIGVAVVNTNDETHLVNNGSKVHLDFSHALKNDVSVIGTFEWGVNPVGDNQIAFNNDSLVERQNSDFFYNRLGYVGFSHSKYGSLTFGKQWGAWYDVVMDTDYGAVWDGNASGTYTFLSDGDLNGVGRAEQAIQYRNRFGGLSVALQMQVKDDHFTMDDLKAFPVAGMNKNADVNGRNFTSEYGNTYGAGLRYKLSPVFTVTAGYNRGEFDIDYGNSEKMNEVDDIYGGGVVLGDWMKPGFYAAANYSVSRYHDVDNIGRILPRAKGVEAVTSYLFDNNFRIYVQYDDLNAGDKYRQAYDGDKFERQNVITSLQYQYDPQTLIYLENRTDLSHFTGQHENAMSVYDDDGVALGVLYSF